MLTERALDYHDGEKLDFLFILEACRRHKVKGLLYASSTSFLELHQDKLAIDAAPVHSPLTVYQDTNCAIEFMAHTYSHIFRLPTVGLRFYREYDRLCSQLELFNLEESMLKKQEKKSDFTYFGAMVEGIVKMVSHISSNSLVKKEEDAAPAFLYNLEETALRGVKFGGKHRHPY